MLNKFDVLRSFAVKKRGIITGAIVFGLLSTGCSVIIPLFIGQFYNLALHSGSARGKLFESVFGHFEHVGSFFLLFSGFILIRFIFNFFEKYFIGITGESFSSQVRKQLFQKQLHTELGTFELRDTGSYLLRYSGDLKSTQNYLTKGVIQFFNDCFFMVAAFILLSILNTQLTLVLLTALPLLLIINLIVNKKIKAITKKTRNIRSGNLSFVASRLNAILTIKTYNRAPIEIEKFNKRSDKLFAEGKKYHFFSALMQALYLFLLYTALLIMLWLAYLSFSKGDDSMDGSALITFIMLVISIIPVYKRLLKVNMVWISGNVSFAKLNGILNAPEENNTEHNTIEKLNGDICLNAISYAYNDVSLFKDLSLTIKSPGITKLNGESGSGKSTLLKLLTGLYPISTGSISIGDTNLNSISKHQLRKYISYISPALPLLGKTVFEVISYSRKKEKRPKAAQLLFELGYTKNLNEAILDKQITDGGKNLSGSERKLLIIARGLLTEKKYILMDEPFLDLESGSKAKLIEHLYSHKNKHTFIITDSSNTELIYDNIITL
jgi:ABC-type multidrug transport system fused ATPase/permease subunit